MDDIPVNLIGSPGIYVDPNGPAAKEVRSLSDYIDPREDADTLQIIADRLEDLGDGRWREILERCATRIRKSLQIPWEEQNSNAKWGLPDTLFGIPVVVEKKFSTVQMPKDKPAGKVPRRKPKR